MIYYFVSVFLFFCNKYELFHYLPGLNLYRLFCLCFNFCHVLGYIIANFSSIGPKSSVNVSREMYQQLQLTFILY